MEHVYSTESPVTLSSRRLCVAEPHCPSAAIPHLHSGRTGLPLSHGDCHRSYMLFIWLLIIPWLTAQTERERSRRGGGVVLSQHPLHPNPPKSAGRSAAYHTRRSVVSAHERERERCHKEQAKKFKDTLQLCVSAPVPPNWFLCKLPAWSCIVKAFVSGLEKAFGHPSSPAKATPFSTPATPWEDCLDTGSSMGVTVPKGIDALRQGRWGQRWEMDLRGYHWEVGADLDCLLVKEHVHQTWSDLTPGLPSLHPYWSAVMTSWQASST